MASPTRLAAPFSSTEPRVIDIARDFCGACRADRTTTRSSGPLIWLRRPRGPWRRKRSSRAQCMDAIFYLWVRRCERRIARAATAMSLECAKLQRKGISEISRSIAHTALRQVCDGFTCDLPVPTYSTGRNLTLFGTIN